MNLLEHYIIDVKSIKEFDTFVEAEVFCDCWGDKRVLTHFASKQAWEKELKQGYFLA